MEAAEIIRAAQADGLRISLAEDGGIDFEGPEQVARRWLPAIREHKAVLVEHLAPQSHASVPALPVWCRGAVCYRFVPLAEPYCMHDDGGGCSALHLLAACPAGEIVPGLPCGRCGCRQYVPAPGAWLWPDGERGDGWRCIGCGNVYLRHGGDLVRQQAGPRLSEMFVAFPPRHFVTVN